jgi:HD-GYP domain-containing protein (c-di-GMP phosphodiesterase class II)
VLGQHLAAAAGVDPPASETTWWVSALRFLGCTGHAFETAVVFGDEIQLRAWSLQADASDPIEFLRKMLASAGPDRTGLARLPAVVSILAKGKKAAQQNFHMACEVADAFAARLGMSDAVRASLATNFERWNGRGLPEGRTETEIPLPMRIAQLAQELEVLARATTPRDAIEVIGARRGKAYDPRLTDIAVDGAADLLTALDGLDPWDEALALAPEAPELAGPALREVLLVLADFADLKSPWTGGHSRAVAELAVTAVGDEAEAPALVHDLGRVAVPNVIWDKPGPLSHDERDRVESHALVTDQLLRRTPFTATLASGAAAHERCDGSGYHRRVGASQLGTVQRIIAAADCYQAMTSDRPHRPALPATQAAADLRDLAAEGRLDGEAVERVLEAAGHRRRARVRGPAGLTARECDVLRFIALGSTTRQIADQLVISRKTADRHVQNIYTKIGVSTRGAAALFAIEHGILTSTR